MIEENVNSIINSIEQIISDEMKIYGNVTINTVEKNGSYTKYLDIKSTNKSFKIPLDLEISVEEEPLLYQSLLNALIDKFAHSDYVGISKCQYIMPSEPITVPRLIDISNVNTSSYLRLELFVSNKESLNIIKEYNEKLKKIEYEQNNAQIL